MSRLLIILVDIFFELSLGSSWSVTGNLRLQNADCCQASQAKVLTEGGDLREAQVSSLCLLAILALERIAGLGQTP